MGDAPPAAGGPPAYARVALPLPLGQAFTYALPARLAGQASRGARVLCELGRRRVLGVLLEPLDDPGDVPPDKLKPILEIVDGEPPLPGELLDFLLALTRYYLAPVGEVMRLALPTLERAETERLGRQGELSGLKVSTVGRLVQKASAVAPEAQAEQLTGQARAIFEHLCQQGPAPLAELARHWGNARTAVKRLAETGHVSLQKVALEHDPFAGAPSPERDSPPELTSAQSVAVARITAALEERETRSFLLHGVTASGKTEVYLHAVAVCLAAGRGALVLVPEIALTPQLVGRFRARLGQSIAVLHSGLSPRDRRAMWKRLRSGELRVAIGARSALFAPVEALGLVCVDEEHDSSFKQEEGVRYNARDMALLRAKMAGAVCVLGSATPSLGSVHLVERGKLERLSLPTRAHRGATLPLIEVVDLKRIGPGSSGEKLLSLPLQRAIEEVLARGEQAILFLNRRGFAPSIVCDDCGGVIQCPHCAVALTLHRRRGDRLVCHYCDFQRPLPQQCDECRSPRLAEEGTGTERVETRLVECYPKARIARLDRDVAAGAKSEAVLDRMRAGEIDLLVGTQMVTKGHDLPGVSLVGVLNADAALSMPDFRAAERSFHLIVQVAGRAGRRAVRGRVIIQTRQPEHPAIQFAAHHDVEGFTAHEMRDREELGYPPFGRLALVRVDGTDERLTEAQCASLGAIAGRAAQRGTEVLGPSAAPLARLRNRWRFRIMLRGPSPAALRAPLLAILRAGHDRRVRVAVDVDPINML